MAPLGSVPWRRGHLCSLPGPRPGPEERVLLLGLRDRSLQGSPLRPLRSGSGRLGRRPRPQAALAPHPPRPTQPPHTPPGDARGAGAGRAQLPGAGGRGEGPQTGPGRTDTPTDRRTAARASRPASHKTTPTATKEHLCGRHARVRLRGADANHISREALRRSGGGLRFPEGVWSPGKDPTRTSVWHSLLGSVVPGPATVWRRSLQTPPLAAEVSQNLTAFVCVCACACACAFVSILVLGRCVCVSRWCQVCHPSLQERLTPLALGMLGVVGWHLGPPRRESSSPAVRPQELEKEGLDGGPALTQHSNINTVMTPITINIY